MTLPYGLIEALVTALNIGQPGFVKPKPEYDENDAACGRDMGERPCDLPEDLLKLYLHGYYNRIRSSRMLERECARNIEVQWLINELLPNYHTIADFRKDHRKELKGVFKKFTSFFCLVIITTSCSHFHMS